MPKYKIVYNRNECIGSFACSALAPELWKNADDSKVDLINGKLNPETGFFELIIGEEDYEKAMHSAEVCPVLVIMIDKIEDSGEVIRIYPEK